VTEYKVCMRDGPHVVTVLQKSKNVWVAEGSYRGKTIRVQNRSESSALKRWIQAVHSASSRSPKLLCQD
jgi:hypothetical protein